MDVGGGGETSNSAKDEGEWDYGIRLSGGAWGLSQAE